MIRNDHEIPNTYNYYLYSNFAGLENIELPICQILNGFVEFEFGESTLKSASIFGGFNLTRHFKKQTIECSSERLMTVAIEDEKEEMYQFMLPLLYVSIKYEHNDCISTQDCIIAFQLSLCDDPNIGQRFDLPNYRMAMIDTQKIHTIKVEKIVFSTYCSHACVIDKDWIDRYFPDEDIADDVNEWLCKIHGTSLKHNILKNKYFFVDPFAMKLFALLYCW